MSSEHRPRIAVQDLWKTFWFYRRPIHRFTNWLSGGRHGAPTPLHTLRNINFTVQAGTSAGIIGVNGAGKSTLLKIITGTMEPTRGRVYLDGRIASLLELGTGFHPLFTGRQNIVYNARFLGLGDAEIAERIPEIEAFSELGDFLDRPLRTYSSGMYIRLAFSVAASVDPDVLIVDEVLSVGDAYFQQKCTQRIREFRDRGVTILFVSHDPTAVRTLCDRALLLHDAEIVDDGAPATVLEHYNAVIARKKADSDYLALEKDGEKRGGGRSGTFAAMITDVELLDDRGRPVRALLAGSEATLRIRVFFFQAVHDPTVGVVIRDRLGNEVWGTNTRLWELASGDWRPGDSLEVRIKARLRLGNGQYSVTAAVHTGEVHVFDPFDWFEGALIFSVLPAGSRRTVGVVQLEPEIALERGPAPDAPSTLLTRAFGAIPSELRTAGPGGQFLRSGWYAAEGGAADGFRWTERASVFLLSVDGPMLGFDLGVTRPSGAPSVELTVRSLGRELGHVQVPDGSGWKEVFMPLPSDFPPGPARFEILVSDCWRPCDTGHSADPRALGVRIRRIWSTPSGGRVAVSA